MLSLYLLWLVVGALLIVGELMTGTFYLLIFGLAAWAAAAVAYVGHGLNYQLVVLVAFALVGLVLVRRYGKNWRGSGSTASDDLDVGNEVRIDMVVDHTHLKVFYRGATWDAVVGTGDTTGIHVGDLGVIRALQGNTLVIERPTPIASS